MSQLVRLFFLIAISRKGPQDVPHSLFLFIATVVLTFVIELTVLYFIIPRKVPLEIFQILKFLLVTNGSSIAMVYLIFYTHRYKTRFLQSITAIFGTGIIISVVSIPVWLLQVFAFTRGNGLLQDLSFIIAMFVIGWRLFVNMHIFRFGLSVSPFYAGALSLVLFALGIFVFNLLIPVEVSS